MKTCYITWKNKKTKIAKIEKYNKEEGSHFSKAEIS
jgi:hypothetical protein